MALDLSEKTSMDDVIREISRLRNVVTDAVEDGVESAVKALKQGREFTEDAIDDARRTVRQKPFQAVGVVFAVGILTGAVLAWMSSRRS